MVPRGEGMRLATRGSMRWTGAVRVPSAMTSEVPMAMPSASRKSSRTAPSAASTDLRPDSYPTKEATSVHVPAPGKSRR